MEIIEKQVEKVKEVPTDGYYGYGRRDVNGITLSFCLYCKYFTYTSRSNLFTML